MSLVRRLAAEGGGTLVLVAAVVGSGIMAERLAEGNLAVALLANALATVAILVVMITILAPISGAHFNPAVTLVMALSRELSPRAAVTYVGAQFAGGIAGTVLAHAMFAAPLISAYATPRTGTGQWLSEAVAAFGLIVTIQGARVHRPQAVATLVSLYIGAAYWFTASTSFANPAVALARAFTDSFAGIRFADVPAFVAAEIAGALAATLVCRALFVPNAGSAASR